MSQSERWNARRVESDQSKPTAEHSPGWMFGFALFGAVGASVVFALFLQRNMIVLNPFGLVLLFGATAFCAVFLFAPNRVLASPQIGKLIGTANPLVARIACGFGVLLLGIGSISIVLNALGRIE